MLAAVILLLALTRAEIIERFRAQPLVKANGLVETVADCPADMRKEFLSPVASYAAGICKSLARSQGTKAAERRFPNPGIIIHIGDVRTNLTSVTSIASTRADGSALTRIYVPAPGFADIARFRIEVAKAYFRAADGAEKDDAGALEAIIEADPEMRIAAQYERLADWEAGRLGAEDGEHPDEADEEYLKLARSVIQPGVARKADVLRFAARLRLYPTLHGAPFCGRYADCTFREAVLLAAQDPRLRFAALEKAPLVVAFGGGHGDALSAAAQAYSTFLFDLARFTKPQEELLTALFEADALLSIALEEAKANETNNYGQYN